MCPTTRRGRDHIHRTFIHVLHFLLLSSGQRGRPYHLREDGDMLTGKRLVITGVLTSDSIAFAVAERA
ncbi:MAG TPA: hypothetical protein VKP11_05435 [Frankiaceae bacterium]|nr:hypothetical protein [Frankiaceae bacterium]